MEDSGARPQDPGSGPALKILFVKRGEFSGNNRALPEALRRAGCEVQIARLSLRALPYRPLILVMMFAQAILLYGRRFRRHLDRTSLSAWAKSASMKRLLRKHPTVDAVVCGGSASFSMPAERALSVRYALVTDHFNFLSKELPDFGVDIPEKRVHRSWELIERRAVSSYDHVFVLGCHVRNAAIHRWSLDPDRITAIGAGPNHDVDVERDRASKSYSDQRLLFVGKDGSRKGLADILRAFGQVHEFFPSATLHLVGGAFIEQSGVVNHGKLYGDDLHQLFYDSQILLLPSYREPFGIALLEGMWSKCVCIGSRIGAIPEIIQDGLTGYTVEPGDTAMLAARMETLLSEPTRLQNMAEEGYSAATERWHWDHAVRQMLEELLRAESRRTMMSSAVALRSQASR